MGIDNEEATALLSLNEDAVKKAWEKQLRWAKLFDQKSFIIGLCGKACIAFSLIGAFLETLATELSGNAATIVGYVGGAFLTAVVVLKYLFLTENANLQRVNSLMISEEIKSEVYQYRTEIGVYGERNPGRELQHRVVNITELNSDQDLNRLFTTVSVKNDGELVPIVPDGKTIEVWYMENRFDPLLSLLDEKILLLTKRALFLERFESFFAALAALIAFLATSDYIPEYFNQNRVAVWVPVATTASALVSKYSTTHTTDAKTAEWKRDKQSLVDLRFQFYDTENRDFAKFVTECESIVGKVLKEWKEIVTKL